MGFDDDEGVAAVSDEKSAVVTGGMLYVRILAPLYQRPFSQWAK
jgi:hypothetical protein